MGTQALAQLFLFLGVLLVLAWPMGAWLARIAGDGPVFGLADRIERPLYRLAGVDPQSDMSWKEYCVAVLVFSASGVAVVFALQLLQGVLPLNPQKMVAVSWDSALNTAVSFVTNTNWQGYGGESTMSYLTQMLALTVQNFLSAAAGIAVAFALIRGFARHSAAGIGNFWVDLVRVTLWVLLPMSIVIAVFFVGQGVIQNLDPYREVPLVEKLEYEQPKVDAAGQPVRDEKGNPVMEKASTTTQTIAMGPVASQEAIKMLGTNGGGFFNANSAHPYENPTPLSNFVQILAIFIIPAALCFTFGRMVGDGRQGWAILGSMTVIFVVMALVAMAAEGTANPLVTALGVDGSSGNMEGKETRFGIVASALFATVTTAASCGAVNAMHDSFMPLGGLVPMWLIQLGEVVFGGVGSGLYGMLVYAVLGVFVAGLMVGRTPEYLGKRIESFEMKMVAVAILICPLIILGGTAVSVLTEAGRAGVSNPGAHGFSQILYAWSSAAGNNGSAFAGISANTPFYNLGLAFAMWVGRFGVIVPVLAMAGSLAAKKRASVTAGTMPTHGPLFVVLLVGTVLLVGALTFIPALALGPIAEHFQLFAR
jgi:potassium-transporting ATPase potassium-binding subunit